MAKSRYDGVKKKDDNNEDGMNVFRYRRYLVELFIQNNLQEEAGRDVKGSCGDQTYETPYRTVSLPTSRPAAHFQDFPICLSRLTQQVVPDQCFCSLTLQNDTRLVQASNLLTLELQDGFI